MRKVALILAAPFVLTIAVALLISGGGKAVRPTPNHLKPDTTTSAATTTITTPVSPPTSVPTETGTRSRTTPVPGGRTSTRPASTSTTTVPTTSTTSQIVQGPDQDLAAGSNGAPTPTNTPTSTFPTHSAAHVFTGPFVARLPYKSKRLTIINTHTTSHGKLILGVLYEGSKASAKQRTDALLTSHHDVPAAYAYSWALKQ
jgi:hypothetical protein